MNKNAIRTLCGLALLSLALYAPSVLADEFKQEKTTTETTTTTTNSSGTISQFGPDSFMIKTSTSSAPVTYEYTETTTYVDEAGNPVQMETVKAGVPVTVYFSKSGDKMVATKVVVKKTTTTTPRG
jgi:hypothetical protein